MIPRMRRGWKSTSSYPQISLAPTNWTRVALSTPRSGWMRILNRLPIKYSYTRGILVPRNWQECRPNTPLSLLSSKTNSKLTTSTKKICAEITISFSSMRQTLAPRSRAQIRVSKIQTCLKPSWMIKSCLGRASKKLRMKPSCENPLGTLTKIVSASLQ